VDRQEKETFVANLKDVFNTSAVVVVAQNTGLTVAKMNELRSAMRDAGGQIKVIKNKLTKIALDGTPLSAIEEYLNGPSMLAYSDDPVAAPKIAIKFAKENKNFVVLGGSLPEKKIDLGEVKQLASLPSLDELRAKILGLMNTPAGNIASLVNTPGTNLAQVVKAFSEKSEAA
jgi:large subunit ribosomal protein L10